MEGIEALGFSDDGGPVAREPETAEERRAMRRMARTILAKLRDIMARAEAGEPVYAEMAARIDARERERAEALIREALEG